MNESIIFRCMFLLFLVFVKPTQQWWESPKDGPTCKDGTCGKKDKTCECSFTITHRLTMMTKEPPMLVRPYNGKLYLYNDTRYSYPLSEQQMSEVIQGDGYKSRLVIAINGKFPGPTIEAYEDQDMIIHVRNLMHTDSTTIHWHGMHQKGTPLYDGVAFITQIPILPGEVSTYKFNASPHGTSFYHAHIGDQRSMGLYGGLVVYPKHEFYSQPQIGFNILLQDWNHDDEPETLYQRMLNGVYDFERNKLIEPTQSIDGANFSRFHMHSGLINGKGRYFTDFTNNNGAPLETFEVEHSKTYRFRVISAATLYPFRVYVQGHHELNIRASDGFEIVKGIGKDSMEIIAESFIIHPGERYDFTVTTNKNPGSYLLVAESIEDLSHKSPREYHAAEAIIRYKDTPFQYLSRDVPEQVHCTSLTPCLTFNCPYLYYPKREHRRCMTFDEATSNEYMSSYKEIQKVDKENTIFFNFAFPGEPGNTLGSVNGRQFLPPASPIYPGGKIKEPCTDSKCGPNKTCSCTYKFDLSDGKVYQFVLTNLGNGKGWSHPIHLHGHYFFVLKMGFGKYDENTGKFLLSTNDINCGFDNYCNSPEWADGNWTNPDNIPGLQLEYPPEKDTIIVPTGGYVIIRFKANNPGTWFFHCHIDLHNTNGMGMVLFEAKNKSLGIF